MDFDYINVRNIILGRHDHGHLCGTVCRAQLLFSVLEEGIPFRKWTAKLLVAWLEVWVGVPFWYIAALRNCLDSGETLAVCVCSCVCVLMCVRLCISVCMLKMFSKKKN